MQRDVISLQRLSPKTKEITIKIKIKKAIGRFFITLGDLKGKKLKRCRVDVGLCRVM